MNATEGPLFKELFETAKEEILASLGRTRYRLWFRDAAIERVVGRNVTLAVPTEVHRTWLEFNYAGLLDRAFARALGEGTHVDVRVSERLGAVRAMRDALPPDEAGWRALLARTRPAPSLLGFVTDEGNAFAVRLVEQVLHGNAGGAPAALYLFGESGSGKTHLLRALEGTLATQAPGSCAYLTARQFTSRFVGALRTQESAALRAFEAEMEGRSTIVIDGLDDLEPRPATQRALDGLFDRTEGRGVRFVVAGRAHPRSLPGLSERLRSRLLGGVLFRLPAPDRRALGRILVERAKAFGTTMPEEVEEAIVSRCSTVLATVELCDRWSAVSARRGEPADLAWIAEMAAPASPATPREEVVRRAKDLVTSHYGIPRGVLDRASKHPSSLLARRVAMYLVWRSTALPLTELAKSFGLRSHSAASRAIQEVRSQREDDPSLEVTVDGLLARL